MISKTEEHADDKARVDEREIFSTDITFEELGLSGPVLDGLRKHGFKHPTIIQHKLIPLALKGVDILGQSKTGTGKTAAFGLPIMQKLDGNASFASMILVPTRELAIQVTHELRELGRFTDLKIMAVYGGQKMSVQIEKLKKKPHVIVGTPGRVMDMHGRGFLPYENVQIAVLDEVDRMLDIGFRDDIRRILGGMRQKHQTIFVSATISPEIEKLSRQYMHKPERLIITSSKSLTVSQVTQRYFSVQPWDKNKLLVHLLKKEKPLLTLVFCRTKHTVDALTQYLNRKGVEANAIHGDMYQGQRNRVMQKLRGGELSVLVASDLAARGLDVDDITHVINFDMPVDAETYVHRIGRTARAGASGAAVSFCDSEERGKLRAIERLTGERIAVRADQPEFATADTGAPAARTGNRWEGNGSRGRDRASGRSQAHGSASRGAKGRKSKKRSSPQSSSSSAPKPHAGKRQRFRDGGTAGASSAGGFSRKIRGMRRRTRSSAGAGGAGVVTRGAR
jgi:ATP-dependent RNA helicase DeaD